MDNQNQEPKFETTPEIASLNVADFELLYKKLADEDAELYGGGVLPYYFENECGLDMYGGSCPYALTECTSLIACGSNTDKCSSLVACYSNEPLENDGCRGNKNSDFLCFSNAAPCPINIK